MSTNCIDNCGNERTKPDGLCDDCRLPDCPDCGGRSEVEMWAAFPGVFIACKGDCDHAIAFGRNYAEAKKYWGLLKGSYVNK